MIVAAATPAHEAIVRLAIARGVPALVEKPLASTEEQGAALRAAAIEAGATIVMAHNSLHAPGLGEVLATPLRRPSATYVLRRTPGSGDAMRTWSGSFLYETVYHVLAVVGRACGGGAGEVVKASYRGEARPEQLRLQLRYGEAPAEITLDYAAAVEEDALGRREIDSAAGARPAAPGARGHDHRRGGGARHRVGRQRRPAHARQLPRRPLGKAEPGATLDEALDVMRTARRVVDAVAAEGAPFERPNAPKHVASRAVQQPFR